MTKRFTQLASLSTPADDDIIAIVDTSTGITKKMRRDDFFSGLVPSGVIAEYGGTVAPTGWLLCDGSIVNRSTYASLFAAIGTAYGAGDGSTTFQLPDIRGKVVVGYTVGDTDFNTLGKTGGVKTNTLTHSHTSPAHTHGTDVQGYHGHNTSSGSANMSSGLSDRVYSVASAGSPGHYHNGSTDGQGSHGHNITYTNANTDNAAPTDNNLQPYIALPLIIKI